MQKATVKSNNLIKAKEALKYIKDINMPGKNGCNALIFAALYGSFSCAEYFLKLGSNPSSSDYKSKTTLMYALDFYQRTKDNKIFKLLIKHHANIDSLDVYGKNLEIYLIEKDCLELKEYLN